MSIYTYLKIHKNDRFWNQELNFDNFYDIIYMLYLCNVTKNMETKKENGMISVENLVLPEGKCALDRIAELGELAENAWIYFSKERFYELRKSAQVQGKKGLDSNIVEFGWSATEQYPATKIWFRDSKTEWYEVMKIMADDITFKERKPVAARIYFIV